MTPLQFTKATRVFLKSHPDFTERWLQDRILDDPSILGLGDVELVTAEKIQPKAGRLDLLLHDEQLNRRYEVELMLGATDPSHIMRCIEYWDIERRRYPAYDHVAVLIAEDITSRFLNLMALLAGSIPLIAIQVVALQVDGKIAIHFVHVLDQTALRTDDEYESGGGAESDREGWEKWASPDSLKQCDKVQGLVQDLAGDKYSLSYLKNDIRLVSASGQIAPVWLFPRRTLVRVGAYVDDPEAWVKRFDDAGQTASLKKGNKAVAVSFKPQDFETNAELLRQLLSNALGVGESKVV